MENLNGYINYKKNRTVLWIACFFALMIYVFSQKEIRAFASGNYSEPVRNAQSYSSNASKCFVRSNNDGSFSVYYVSTEEDGLILYKKVVTLSGEVKKTLSVQLPGKVWGGCLYESEDGYIYVATGYDSNYSNIYLVYFSEDESVFTETKDETAYCFIKLTRDLEIIGTVEVSKEESFTNSAYRGGNCDMEQIGDILVVHAARERFDGHQSNITFYIDTNSMTKLFVSSQQGFDHVSHSFNQFVRCDNGKVYTVDHGDGYPRGVCFQIWGLPDKVSILSGSQPYENHEMYNLFGAWGNIGENYTGLTVNGFEIGKNNFIIVGTSIPHDQFVSWDEYEEYTSRNELQDVNAYIIFVDRNEKELSFRWLTDYRNNNISNLKLIKIDNDDFLILYGRSLKKKHPYCPDFENGEETCFIRIDSSGNIKEEGTLKKQFFCNSEADVYGKDIVWCHYVDNKLGSFLVMSVWDTESNTIKDMCIQTDRDTSFDKIAFSDNTPNVRQGEIQLITVKVYYDDCFNDFAGAPALWTTSDSDIVQIIDSQSVVDGWSKMDGSYSTCSIAVKCKAVGTSTITCTIGDSCIKRVLEVKSRYTPSPVEIVSNSMSYSANNVNCTVWWDLNGDNKPDGYQVQVAQSNKFKKNVKKITVKNGDSNSAIIDDLENEKDYYIRVRSYVKVDGKNYYSDWSNVVTVATADPFKDLWWGW